MELGQILGLVFGGIFLIVIILLAIFKKDFLKCSTVLTPILKALLTVLKAVGNIFPDKTVINTMVLVISTAITAAGHAEELWLNGIIDKKDRPGAAEEYIKKVLSSASIEVTSDINAIIQGAISLTCYLMPHYEEKEA